MPRFVLGTTQPMISSKRHPFLFSLHSASSKLLTLHSRGFGSTLAPPNQQEKAHTDCLDTRLLTALAQHRTNNFSFFPRQSASPARYLYSKYLIKLWHVFFFFNAMNLPRHHSTRSIILQKTFYVHFISCIKCFASLIPR